MTSKDIKWGRQGMRNSNMTIDKNLPEDSWEREIPFDTRQEAIMDAAVAYKTNLLMSKHKKIGSFKMHFKSRKDRTQIFKINKTTFKNGNIFPQRLKHHKNIKYRNKMQRWVNRNIDVIESNFIIYRSNNRYYLCLPMTRKSEKIESSCNDVYLDPGVRTFQAFYSPSGMAGEIGNGFNNKLQMIGEREDNLKSLKIKKKRTKRNINQRRSKLRAKIKNKVNDLHWKSADFLCKNFDNIFLPTFQTKQMVKKNGILRPKTSRQMMMLSHYAFKEKLRFKSSCYGKTVIDCSEAYTSKTCGFCGELNTTLGGSKTFTCHCGYKLDRDIHGARNIYLRTISPLI
jgi:putative transposase